MDTVRIQESKKGNSYSPKILKNKAQTITRANLMFSEGGVTLKLGRYKKPLGQIETETPKSELSLDNDELNELVKLLQEKYNLVLYGKGEYIKASEDLNDEFVQKLKVIFEKKDKIDVINFFLENNLLSEDLEQILEKKKRLKAVEEFEEKLEQNEVEYEWQKWFEENDWVLGNEYVEILDERKLDTKNTVDYFMRSFDGFVDIIEIKRPGGNLMFWSNEKDHGNLIPHTSLVRAITQTQNYIFELEREMDSIKTADRISGARIVKPRATLIYGRSNEWGDDENIAFRLLNNGYQNLNIMTYDQVLARARRAIKNGA